MKVKVNPHSITASLRTRVQLYIILTLFICCLYAFSLFVCGSFNYIGCTELRKVTCDAFSVEVVVWRYIGYSTVTLVTVHGIGKSVYLRLHA